MENSSTIRRRAAAARNARESTPEPSAKLIRVGSERKSRAAATDGDDEDINTVYVVKGILNVGGSGSGATSPTGSISSSSSSSGNNGGNRSSGSHAYRAKILRYMHEKISPHLK